jgi:hypothetical protein
MPHPTSSLKEYISCGARIKPTVQQQMCYSSNTVYTTRVEAGSNTSIVTLRVVRGDEMGQKKGRAIS